MKRNLFMIYFYSFFILDAIDRSMHRKTSIEFSGFLGSTGNNKKQKEAQTYWKKKKTP